MLTSLSHHELLVFWTELLALFAVAWALGAFARRLGLPSVVGELSAGLILGPSILGVVAPGLFDWFLPSGEEAVTQSAMLLAVSWFSAAFLLVVAGFETDLALISRLGRAAALVTTGSVIVPLIGGLVAGWLMPVVFYGAVDGGRPDRIVFALFIAASVAVSALAVIAKILSDLNLMRRDVGQITIAAGMANDLVGWVILGVIAGLAASGHVSAIDVVATVGGLAIFMVGAFTIGQRLVDAALRLVRREGHNVRGALTVILATMLTFGVLTQALGVEAVLGTFVAGVVLARSRYQQVEAEHTIEDLTSVIFAPLFFATAGLRLDLSLLRGSALGWALLLLLVALGLKFAGSFLGAKLGGLTTQEGFVLGSGLNARGALEIIIATVGLSLGVFNQTTFTMIVMIPLVTSLLASIGLRVFSRGLEGSVAERERLAREQALESNLLIRNNRILLPSASEANSIVAAQIVHFAWPPDLAATVLAVRSNGAGPNIDVMGNVLYGREFEVAELDPGIDDATAAMEIIAQSRLGYGVIALGAGIESGHGQFGSSLVDEVLNRTDLPVVIVRKAMNHPGRLPGVFAQALVPIAGSHSSQAALELAANLSSNLGTHLLLSHVVYRPRSGTGPGSLFDRFRASAFAGSDDVAGGLLAEALRYAMETRATADTEVRFAGSPAVEIVKRANAIEADLVVIGAQVRRVPGRRPSLGPNVEHVLEHCPQTVVVVVMPDQRSS
ncbi:MAG: cation:proton antiporter [Acidimicrobiia bacterium]|nr:cation:proton antiporter [Acidimicrobiia bacterium]